LLPSRSTRRPHATKLPQVPGFLSLTLAVAKLYLLARGDPAQLPDPEPLPPLEPSVEDDLWEVDRRSKARRQIISALIDGQPTFHQAAAGFRDINANLPDKVRRRRPPRYTEEEWAYRQVIQYVWVEFRENRHAPAQADEWVARLEAELQEQFRHDVGPPPAPGS
jgi:hypothetical protein